MQKDISRKKFLEALSLFFQGEGVWAHWPYMYSYNWLFSRQNKNILGKSSSGLLFTANTL